MRRRDIILQEAEKWKQEGIISAEQFQQIAGRYPVLAQSSSLPVLGAILLGLGALTFIASNWQEVSPFAKLAIILLSLIVSYAAGEWFRSNGSEKIGLALTVIGVAIYGAGFFLIGQIYHLSANPVNAFYLWFVGAVTITYYYRSRLLTYFSLLILTISVFYGVFESYRDGLATFLFYVLFAIGIVPFILKYRTATLLALSQLLLFGVAFYDLHKVDDGLAFPALCLLFYLAARYLPRSLEPLSETIQAVSYWVMIFYSILAIFIDELIPQQNGMNTRLWIVLLLLSGWYLIVSVGKKSLAQAIDLIPYGAFALLYLLVLINPANIATILPSVLLIVSLFLYGVGMVLAGERQRNVSRINQGAVLFGISCFVGYVNLAWDFMDKSLFFLMGGALLLALSLLVEWQRRKWVNEAKGGRK